MERGGPVHLNRMGRLMAWTYSDNPADVPRDLVRLLLGDTDQNVPLRTDAQVDYATSLFPDARRAAAFLADQIVALYGRRIGTSLGPVTIDYAARAEHFRALAVRLRTEADSGVVGSGVPSVSVPFAPALVTGATVSGVLGRVADTDRLPMAAEDGLRNQLEYYLGSPWFVPDESSVIVTDDDQPGVILLDDDGLAIRFP